MSYVSPDHAVQKILNQQDTSWSENNVSICTLCAFILLCFKRGKLLLNSTNNIQILEAEHLTIYNLKTLQLIWTWTDEVHGISPVHFQCFPFPLSFYFNHSSETLLELTPLSRCPAVKCLPDPAEERIEEQQPTSVADVWSGNFGRRW